MSVFQPAYIDQKTRQKKRSKVWWFEFIFAGRRIRESTKSKRKTIAIEAERKRRLDLERGINDCHDVRVARIQPISEVADRFLEEYRLRHKSAKFAEYALGHVKRLKGSVMVVDVDHQMVTDYQSCRLREGASPKSINEEVLFILRILEEKGDVIRAKMRRQKTLRLKAASTIAQAFTKEQRCEILKQARARRSPHIYPALMINLNTGLRDAEIRELQWERIDFERSILRVGDAKTEAGQGRVVPMNSDLRQVLIDHASWYLEKFGETRPSWYVFPFGKPQPTDPTRSTTTFKTAWANVRRAAGVTGRWHDGRHTFVTDLAESGEASDETIRQLAGHVSKKMLQHYAHISLEAKRRAVEAIVRKSAKSFGPGGNQSSPGMIMSQ